MVAKVLGIGGLEQGPLFVIFVLFSFFALLQELIALQFVPTLIVEFLCQLCLLRLVPSSSSSVSSLEVRPEVVVKLFRRGEGDVGIQLVRRGGVVGRPTTFPGDVHAAATMRGIERE